MIIKRAQSGGGTKVIQVATVPIPNNPINNTINVGDLVVVKDGDGLITYVKEAAHTNTSTGLKRISHSQIDYRIRNEKAIPVTLANGRYEFKTDQPPRGGLINDTVMVLLSDGTTIDVTGSDVSVEIIGGTATPMVKLPAADTAELTSLGIDTVSVSYLHSPV